MSAQDGKGEPLGIPPVRDPRLGRAGVAGLGTSHAPLPPLDLPHIPDGDFEDGPGAAAVRPAGSAGASSTGASSTGASSTGASSTGASSTGASSVPGAEPGTFGERLDRFQVPKRGAGLRSAAAWDWSWLDGDMLAGADRLFGWLWRYLTGPRGALLPWLLLGLLVVFGSTRRGLAELDEQRTARERRAYKEALRVVRIRLLGIPAEGWSEPPWDPPHIIAVINDVLGDDFRRDVTEAEQLAPGISQQFLRVDSGLRVLRPDISHR